MRTGRLLRERGADWGAVGVTVGPSGDRGGERRPAEAMGRKSL